MYEFSYTENPPNCVGGIRELFYCRLIASLLLALLLNTSRSLLLLSINCLVSTMRIFKHMGQGIYFVYGMTKALERLDISVALYAYVKC
jgi:hypothetical protein